MTNINAQKSIARMLAASGMDAQSAAMHTAMIAAILQQSPKLSAHVRMAEESDDMEYRVHVVKSLLSLASKLIADNPDTVKHALS